MGEYDDRADRAELTEDEREALEDAINESLDTYANASFLIPAVESIVAARVQALTAERDELQEKHTEAESDLQEALSLIHDLEQNAGWVRLLQQRDAARAELASTNTRCAELEAKYAAEVRRHEETDGEWSAEFSEVKKANAALQATLDRVTALADNLSGFIPTDSMGSPAERIAARSASRHWEEKLRAALTPEGKP